MSPPRSRPSPFPNQLPLQPSSVSFLSTTPRPMLSSKTLHPFLCSFLPVDLLPPSSPPQTNSSLLQSPISSALLLSRYNSPIPSTSSAATPFSSVVTLPSSNVDTIDSFVLIDDFLSLGSPQFFCYSLASSFPYTLCDSSHATLLADSLHGHHSSLSNAARNVFVHELSVRRTRLQEVFHAIQPVNDALQALLQGNVHAADDCLNNRIQTITHTDKRNKRSAAAIRSYRCERHGEALELHITGEVSNLTGVGTVQAATQLASFQQFCDAFTISSTFDATIRIFGTCPSSLSLFLCTSSHTLFLGTVTLRPMACEAQEKPLLLLKEPPRPSLRALLPQGSTEQFLQSGKWAVELPLTLEEADEWASQLSECVLDLSNLPQCKRALSSLRVSLTEELLYWKSELLVGLDGTCEG